VRNLVHHGVPAAALALGCVLLWGMREQQPVEPRAAMSTIQISAPGYATKNEVIKDAERRIAGMDDYVLRTFQRDTLDAGFSVYVGYYRYQVQGKSIHSPKNCLPGAGWEPLESAPRTVQVDGRDVRVNRYLLANQGVQALVYYWYQGRGRIENDEYRVKWLLLRDAAMYGRTEEALVRIVIPIVPTDLQKNGPQATYRDADARAAALVQQLVPRVNAVLPQPPAAS
jgi:EpsI family protein